jgi:uncharacterized membrane protein YccF (DUF307 family)
LSCRSPRLCPRRSGDDALTETRTGGHVRLVLNILWLVLAGFWLAIGYFVAGVVMFILIITIPLGI